MRVRVNEGASGHEGVVLCCAVLCVWCICVVSCVCVGM